MRRRLVAALVAGTGAAFAAAALVVVARPPATRVSANVAVSPPGPLDSNNSPTLVRNPHQPEQLVVVQRVDRPNFSAALERSTDGGHTWRAGALRLPEGLDRPYAPDAAFAPDGRLYVAYLNLAGPSNFPDNLWVARSGDGGASFDEPVRVAGAGAFQPRVVVDRTGGVYVTWVQAAGLGQYHFGPPPNPVVASRSTDGGRTFSAPVQVSDPARQRVGAAVPAVDSRGRLLVLYEDFGDDTRDFESLAGPPWEHPFALVLAASNDGGASFGTVSVVANDVVAAGRFVVFTPPFPSLAAGRGNDLFVTWTDGRHGAPEALLAASADGGATWRAPVSVGRPPADGDTTGSALYLPAVAVAAGGRVEVAYLDRTGTQVHAVLATSTDGGRTFSDHRLSTRPSDSRVGPGTPFAGPDPGSRLGLVAGGGATVAAWPDTRLGTVDTGRQDLVVARISYGSGLGPVLTWSAVAGALAALMVACATAIRRSL